MLIAPEGAIFVRCTRPSNYHHISNQFTLGKKERLRSRKLIERLFKEGRSFSTYPFRVSYIFYDGGEEPLQAGFSASARNIRKAVHRNRIKRLMKEAYRLQKDEMKALALQQKVCLAVFYIYTGKDLPTHDLVFKKMGLIIKRLVSLLHENYNART